MNTEVQMRELTNDEVDQISGGGVYCSITIDCDANGCSVTIDCGLD